MKTFKLTKGVQITLIVLFIIVVGVIIVASVSNNKAMALSCSANCGSGYMKLNGIYDSNFLVSDYKEEFLWIKNNAHKYGFIVRYLEDKTDITGYIYEPWHLRYVGNIAKFLNKYNLSLEEYYYWFL